MRRSPRKWGPSISQLVRPLLFGKPPSALVLTDAHLVALAYVMQKTPYVFPLVGGRKVEHLLANIEALDISLSEEQIKELESVIPFDLGFPHNFIVSVRCVGTRNDG